MTAEIGKSCLRERERERERVSGGDVVCDVVSVCALLDVQLAITRTANNACIRCQSPNEPKIECSCLLQHVVFVSLLPQFT